MTNQDIINKVKTTPWITWEERCFIVNNYKNASPSESNNWISVCIEGSDFRYGSWRIDPEKMLQRNDTHKEFYRGGVVD